MTGISKADWKLFMERAPEWQEHYMGALIKEYIGILNAPENPSTRFWKLEERIKTDKRHPGVLLEMKKSDAIADIVIFVRGRVITLDDLEGFRDVDIKGLTAKETIGLRTRNWAA